MQLKQFLRLIALLGLLLAPMGMLGSHAAMAMPQPVSATAMSHCADQQKDAPKGHPQPSMIDCALACSTMPAAQLFIPAAPMPAAALFEGFVPAEVEGTMPEAATPPPRGV